MKESGIIFDFNGTLLDDSDKQEKAWRTFAQSALGREITDEEFQSSVHGRNNTFTLEFLAGKALTDQQISQYSDEKEAVYRHLCLKDREHFRLSVDAVRLLDELLLKKTPMTIATASPKDNVDFYIQQLNLGRWFDTDKIIYNDGTIPGKPAPDFYIRAARAIGLPAKNCIVIEDAVSGILSAHSAGIGKVIAISLHYNDETLKQMTEVYSLIHNFDEFDRSLLNGG